MFWWPFSPEEIHIKGYIIRQKLPPKTPALLEQVFIGSKHLHPMETPTKVSEMVFLETFFARRDTPLVYLYTTLVKRKWEKAFFLFQCLIGAQNRSVVI